jgi:hypothetical protein
MSTSAQRNENRMIDEDRAVVRVRMREVVRTWQDGPRNRSIERDVLVRVAAGAIGCGLVDLRDSEIDELFATADEVLDA